MIKVTDKPKEQYQKESPQTVFTKALTIGFSGGILWSGIGALTYFFHFSEVSAASFLIRSYLQNDWSGTWLAEILAIIGVGLLSLVTAMLYYFTLKRQSGIWPGAVFGIILWGLVFVVLTPLFPAIPTFMELTSDTWVTTGCLFILYGVFIGYSISYEFQEFNQPSNSYSKEQGV
ncbi:YqhR family membrane protein [Halobacillus salinus]|uniref:YqhR family membrane protein n=1 Tax=Halobacillus salinus TaxID=192814 RepID=UPI0020CA50F9|nr:YqhR family membrane protein [Halobacillus salinus]